MVVAMPLHISRLCSSFTYLCILGLRFINRLSNIRGESVRVDQGLTGFYCIQMRDWPWHSILGEFLESVCDDRTNIWWILALFITQASSDIECLIK